MNGIKVGMVVDAVSEVLRIQSEMVEPPPSMVVSGIDSAFITGIAKLGDHGLPNGQAGRLVILLDLGKLLSIQECGDLAEKAGLVLQA
jgi:purine-binding chemotaxis protein CheW